MNTTSSMMCVDSSKSSGRKGEMSISYSGRSKAVGATIGRQKLGTIPPVKMVANGHTKPVALPSIKTWISRNGPCPSRRSGKVCVYSVGTLVYQNSSSALPDAEMETTARIVFAGNRGVAIARSDGRWKYEGSFFALFCAVIERIWFAGWTAVKR